MIISKPEKGEYAPHYESYIQEVKTHDLIGALEEGKTRLVDFIKTIPPDKLDYRYQEGKWSVKEIITHLMDAERIFTYRALRFSRNDQTPLAGFDEEEYIPESNASERTIESLLEEYTALRLSSIQFFKNITVEMSLRKGIANGKEISVRALGYAIPGHEMHHLNVIMTRYL